MDKINLVKCVVIRELDNYRGRTEQRYQIMTRLHNRNGLNHTDCLTYTLNDAIAKCNANNWRILAVGDFYQVV